MIRDDSLADWMEARGAAELTGAKLSVAICHGLEPEEFPAFERLMKLSPLIRRSLQALHRLGRRPRREDSPSP